MVKEKGNYLMPFFSSIKVSAYANHLAEASPGRGKNNYYISEERFILCCWRQLEEEMGGRGVRGAKRELLPDLNGVGNGFELSFLS